MLRSRGASVHLLLHVANEHERCELHRHPLVGEHGQERRDKKADEKPLDGFSHPPPKAVPFRRFLLIFLFVGQNSFYNKARIRISDGFWLLLFKHHRMYY